MSKLISKYTGCCQKAVERYARREDGALIIFSLFLFFTLLLIASPAVDLMRYEQQRANVRATLDSATIAAASIQQTRDPAVVIREYFEKAGLDPNVVTARENDERLVGSQTTGRRVSVSAETIRFRASQAHRPRKGHLCSRSREFSICRIR